MVRNIDKNGNDINLSETVVVLTPALATAVAKMRKDTASATTVSLIQSDIRKELSLTIVA